MFFYAAEVLFLRLQNITVTEAKWDVCTKYSDKASVKCDQVIRAALLFLEENTIKKMNLSVECL